MPKGCWAHVRHKCSFLLGEPSLHLIQFFFGPHESTTQTKSLAEPAAFEGLTVATKTGTDNTTPSEAMQANDYKLLQYWQQKARELLPISNKVENIDCTSDNPHILQRAQRCPQNCPFLCGSRSPSYTCFLGLTRVHNPNGISISSAILAHHTSSQLSLTDRQTYRSLNTSNNRPHLCFAVTWPNNIHISIPQ